MNVFESFGFTPEEYLTERVLGLSYTEIAKKHQIPIGSCNYYFSSAKQDNWYGATHKLINPVLDALKSGLTFSEISQKFNLPIKGVKNISVDFNVERVFNCNDYYKLKENGYTDDWIADYYGLGKSYLKKIILSSSTDQLQSFIHCKTGDIISRLYNAGVSIEILAASFQLSSSSVVQYLLEQNDNDNTEKEFLKKKYVEYLRKKFNR